MDRNIIALYGTEFGRGAKINCLRMTRALESRGSTVYPLGNGVREPKDPEISEAFEAAHASGKPTTLLIDAHFKKSSRLHRIIIGRDALLTTGKLLVKLGMQFINVPVDVFLLTFHSAKILPMTVFLSNKSVVAAPCSKNGYVNNDDIAAFSTTLESDVGRKRDLSASNMLHLFLANATKPEWPSYNVSDTSYRDGKIGINAHVDSRRLFHTPVSVSRLQDAARELVDVIPQDKIEPAIHILNKYGGQISSAFRAPYRGPGLSILLASNNLA